MKLFKEIEKAFPRLERQFEASLWAEFINTSYSDLDRYHWGPGTWIRENFLGQDTTLYEMFLKQGVFSKDDMSSLILQLFYLYLKGRG